MEIADDKIFTAAGLAKTQLFAGTEKAKKKKDGDAKDADGAKKTIKKAKPSKEKKAKPVSTGVEEE